VSLTVASTMVQRVSVYKMLGVMVNSDLKWETTSLQLRQKPKKRLWFMKQLRKAGVSQDDLMFYYQSVLRPVLEYACPCWHLNLTKEPTTQPEDVQRHALQVIFGNIPYDEVRCIHNIPKLAEWRLELSRTFFQRIIRDNSNVPCQPSVIFNLRLNCVVLENIQQSMHELIAIKTLLSYMD